VKLSILKGTLTFSRKRIRQVKIRAYVIFAIRNQESWNLENVEFFMIDERCKTTKEYVSLCIQDAKMDAALEFCRANANKTNNKVMINLQLDLEF